MTTESPLLGRRIPELDGLRGIAILLVLFFHYFASAPLPRYVAALSQLTWSGVDLFFVLSGFLIGGILLDARSSPNYFSTFYIRRGYRILPIYMLVLVASWAIVGLSHPENGDAAFRWLFANPFPWYAYSTFTQNFWMMARASLGPNWLSATWSLAVEEQFYLTLPLIIRYVSPRRLPYVLATIIIGAPLLRLLLRLFCANGDIGAFVLMPCRADALMLGVAAALVVRNRKAREALARHKRLLYGVVVILSCGMLWMASKTIRVAESDITQTVIVARQSLAHQSADWLTLSRFYVRSGVSALNYTWIALFYLSLLLVAISQKASLFSCLLRNRLLMGMGVIAYGTYLLHQAILGLCYGLILGRVPGVTNLRELGVTILALLVMLGLAKASWVYLEKAFVGIGHKYHYESRADARK